MLSRRSNVVNLLQKAIDRGLPTHTPQDILDACYRGEMRLWIHPSGETVVVTSVHEFPRMRLAKIDYVAGKMEQVMEMKPYVEEWARENGATVVLAGGRKGWVRVLDDYRVLATQVFKEL